MYGAVSVCLCPISPRPTVPLSHCTPVPLRPHLVVPPSLTPTLTCNGTAAPWDGGAMGRGHNRTERDGDGDTGEL